MRRIMTSTGHWVDPLFMFPEDVRVEDIAHALAFTCRFAGMCQSYYSVAQHSVLGSIWGPAQSAREFLFHDATEAYLLDVPKPYKHDVYLRPNGQLKPFSKVEDRLWKYALAPALGLQEELSEEVKNTDLKMLVTEARDLLPPHWECGTQVEPFPWKVEPWGPEEAKANFLARYAELFT